MSATQPYESDLWDALEEAEDPSAWPDETHAEFRAGYRAALRFALAVVTESPVPRNRPDANAQGQPSEPVNEWSLTPEQQATFDATDCSCEHAPRHSTSCAKWRAVIEPNIVAR